MTSGATIAALAGELAEVLLRGDPFAASFMAISGYDDAVPDRKLTLHGGQQPATPVSMAAERIRDLRELRPVV